MTQTSTYVTLEISQASFDDIKTRLEPWSEEQIAYYQSQKE